MEYLIYIAVSFSLLFYLLHFFSKERKIAKRFKTPKTKYSALSDADEVHVYGRTKLLSELRSPITDESSCYYETIVFEPSKYGTDEIIKNEADWRVLKKEVRSCNFLLEVDLNSILVVVEHSKSLVKTNIDTHSEKLLDSSDFEKYWPRIKGFMEKQGLRVSNAYDKSNKRIKESCIQNDEPLAVVGLGAWHDTSAFPEIEGLVHQEKIYVIYGKEKSPIAFTNLNTVLWG